MFDLFGIALYGNDQEEQFKQGNGCQQNACTIKKGDCLEIEVTESNQNGTTISMMKREICANPMILNIDSKKSFSLNDRYDVNISKIQSPQSVISLLNSQQTGSLALKVS